MNNTAKNTLLATAGMAAVMGGSSIAGSADMLTVKAGDTLSAISRTTTVSVNDIVKANNIANPNLIFIGQELDVRHMDGEEVAPEAVVEATEEVVAPAENVVETAEEVVAPAPVEEATPAPVQPAPVQPQVQKTAPVQPQAQVQRQQNFAGNTYPTGQCTWYVKNALGWVGNYWGNAANWGGSAAAAGRAVNGTPAVGSVAVFGPGVQGASGYGHVAVVEAVYGNGTIKISESNFNGLMYHERVISIAGLMFIH